MARVAASILTLLALSACGSAPQQPSAFYRSGNGLVETVQAVAAPVPPPVRTAEAGGSRSTPLSTYAQPAYASSAYPPESATAGASGPRAQLGVRMDDGSRQQLLAQNPDFRVGDRVHVTPEGRVARE